MKKKKTINIMNCTADELMSLFASQSAIGKRHLVLGISIVFVVGIALSMLISSVRTPSGTGDDIFAMINSTAVATGQKRDLISIPAGTVKANPFLPYRNIGGTSKEVKGVPAYELIAPPEIIDEGSEAARVMDTIVSGILYDKYSPSAILNIEGNDYLVKKGDVVNNYKVLDIARDSVTVKLGANTFKAGIGEILTEGSVNVNEVSNLSKKFGGERK